MTPKIPLLTLIIPPAAASVAGGLGLGFVLYGVSLLVSPDPLPMGIIGFGLGVLIGYWLCFRYWTPYLLDVYNVLEPVTFQHNGQQYTVTEAGRIDNKSLEDKIIEMARKIQDGSKLSHASLANDNPFDRKQYEFVRDILVNLGWAAPINSSAPNQGYYITMEGEKGLESIATTTSLPFEILDALY